MNASYRLDAYARTLGAPLAAALLALLLAACDAGGPAGAVGGVWEGTSAFRADTLLPGQNLRIRADYDMTFRFDLTEEDGLVWGTVTATASGERIVREAGFAADTVRFDESYAMVHDVYGTFADGLLELDVPGGPYQEDLWSFEAQGSFADLMGTEAEAGADESDAVQTFLVSENAIFLQMNGEGEEFLFPIRSEEPFEMRRTSRDPEGAADTPTADLTTLGLRLPFPERPDGGGQ